MRRALLVAALVLVPACGIKLPPCLVDGTCLPTPTPTPTPTPEPTPEPTPTPTPTPEPPPLGGCKYPAAEAQLLASGDGRTLLFRVLELERALGDLRDPKRNPVALARENNRRLASLFRSAGYCAFAGQEAVFIQASDLSWEEYHAAAETDGGWTQNPARGSHSNPGPTTEIPPDAPPIDETPPTACVSVPPLSLFVVHRRDIRDGWEWFDSTPHAGDWAYCQSIGFNRAPCPAGQEGDPNRLRRERCMLGGPAPVWVWQGRVLAESDGHDVRPRDGSRGFGVEHRKDAAGSLKVCNADLTVCSEAL